MATLTATLEHEGQTWEAEPAVIERTSLGWEDHGIFTFNLQCSLSGGGSSQGAGNYFLDRMDPTDEKSRKRIGHASGFTLIMETMKVIGVSDWESIKGKRILVLRNSAGSRFDTIAGIADPDGQRVLIFKDHFDAWRQRATARAYVDGQDD